MRSRNNSEADRIFNAVGVVVQREERQATEIARLRHDLKIIANWPRANANLDEPEPPAGLCESMAIWAQLALDRKAT